MSSPIDPLNPLALGAGNLRGAPEQLTLERLDAQIAWYERQGRLNRIAYKCIKTAVIASAAAIPLLTTSRLVFGGWLAGVLGASIAVLEGIQQLNQFGGNWTSYRNTAEALKHEKYLYLGEAGPYLGRENPHALLAERIEELVSREIAKWFTGQSVAVDAHAGPRADC